MLNCLLALTFQIVGATSVLIVGSQLRAAALDLSCRQFIEISNSDKIAIKVYFQRHDRLGRGRTSDDTWSRKEQRAARVELTKVT